MSQLKSLPSKKRNLHFLCLLRPSIDGIFFFFKWNIPDFVFVCSFFLSSCRCCISATVMHGVLPFSGCFTWRHIPSLRVLTLITLGKVLLIYPLEAKFFFPSLAANKHFVGRCFNTVQTFWISKYLNIKIILTRFSSIHWWCLPDTVCTNILYRDFLSPAFPPYLPVCGSTINSAILCSVSPSVCLSCLSVSKLLIWTYSFLLIVVYWYLFWCSGCSRVGQ